jgi:hypothetical protein
VILPPVIHPLDMLQQLHAMRGDGVDIEPPGTYAPPSDDPNVAPPDDASSSHGQLVESAAHHPASWDGSESDGKSATAGSEERQRTAVLAGRDGVFDVAAGRGRWLDRMVVLNPEELDDLRELLTRAVIRQLQDEIKSVSAKLSGFKAEG